MANPYLKLEKEIGITFTQPKLIENVFVHRSFLNEERHNSDLTSNEKLEFLGDSVLSLITSVYLYNTYPQLNEGLYTDIKASVVRTESLAEIAQQIHLGDYVLLSHGEILNNGRQNKNILADCFEALIAAIFINHGFDSAYNFIEKRLFREKLASIITKKDYLSPKSRLQEIIQAKNKVLPLYKVLKEEGPDHKKYFLIGVYVNDKQIGVGEGPSKKIAEEKAAKNALEVGQVYGTIKH